MLSTPKSKGELFLASSLRDGLEDNDLSQVKTLLLNNEADPNVLFPNHGISPFHLVIGNDSENFAEEVTKLFLRHGGNPNVRSTDGMTPVHVAAAWGRVRVLELLLANGGDPLCLDDEKRSPFHYAFDGAFYDAVALLSSYCATSHDEDVEEEPKYKIRLDKILINRGDCVAEYVPSEISLKSEIGSPKSSKNQFSQSSDESSKTSKYQVFQNSDSPKSPKNQYFQSSESPQSPKSQSFRSSESPKSRKSGFSQSSESPKSRKNGFSQSSESPKSRKNGFSQSSESPKSPKNQLFQSSESPKGPKNRFFEDTDSQKSPQSLDSSKTLENSTSLSTATDFSHLNTRNVTQRRREKSRKPLKTEADLNIAFEECDAEKERLLIGQIIKRLSTGIEKDCEVIRKVAASSALRADNKAVPRRSFLPAPKYYSQDLKCVEKSRFQLADSSIISKSPNIRILGEKTPNTKKAPLFTPKNQNSGYKFKATSSKTPDYKIKSASSTPRKKQAISRISGSVKVTRTEKSRNFEKGQKNTGIFDKTYCKSRFGGLNYSPEIETREKKNIQRRIFPKNIAINLDERLNDNFGESEVGNESKTVNIYNDLRKQTEVSNFKVSEEKKVSREDKKIKIESKTYKNPYFCRRNEEQTPKEFFESPGSSVPVSVSRLAYSNSIRNPEDTKIWLEIEDAFENRCGSPPASVSILEEKSLDSTAFDDTEISSRFSTYSDYGSQYSEIDETFVQEKATNIAFMDSRSCSESFFSVDEEYLYEDAEEGVAFTERHLCVIPSSCETDKKQIKSRLSWIDRFEDLSLLTSDNSVSTSPQRLFSPSSSLDDKTLRDRLTALGEHPGPITKSTFSVYLKRLYRLENSRKKVPEIASSPSKSVEEIGQRSISGGLLSIDWPSKLQFWRNLEEQAFKEYASANPSRKYRGGISKNSFCYLLLDPRITRDLPRSGINLSVEARWSRFLRAIFYVGKGKGARPIAHLYDAFGAWKKRKNAVFSNKIRKILDIWEDDKGVVCLHVFLHTMVEEACSREAAMIDALDTTHLTNCVRGTYYGYTATMNNQEKQSLGKYLLYKAMEILMHEGERQLFPRNVIM